MFPYLISFVVFFEFQTKQRLWLNLIQNSVKLLNELFISVSRIYFFTFKAKSVLEAVNILLSDRNSPFICLIAIDSRIANDCFTDSEKNRDVSAALNGYEYLKKIINLPFCIPEVC